MQAKQEVSEKTVRQDPQEVRQLLLHVAAGERAALAELYDRTRAAVYGLALSYLKNVHDAQDMTQDVYVRVWECAAQYRPDGSAVGWVLAVCRSLCLMHLRRDRRQTLLDEDEWRAVPDTACGLAHEERLLLQDALAALGEQERRIVLLHAAAGLKHREIACLLDLPLATVLSKYHRARKKLTGILEGADIP